MNLHTILNETPWGNLTAPERTPPPQASTQPTDSFPQSIENVARNTLSQGRLSSFAPRAFDREQDKMRKERLRRKDEYWKTRLSGNTCSPYTSNSPIVNPKTAAVLEPVALINIGKVSPEPSVKQKMDIKNFLNPNSC